MKPAITSIEQLYQISKKYCGGGSKRIIIDPSSFIPVKLISGTIAVPITQWMRAADITHLFQQPVTIESVTTLKKQFRSLRMPVIFQHECSDGSSINLLYKSEDISKNNESAFMRLLDLIKILYRSCTGQNLPLRSYHISAVADSLLVIEMLQDVNTVYNIYLQELILSGRSCADFMAQGKDKEPAKSIEQRLEKLKVASEQFPPLLKTRQLRGALSDPLNFLHRRDCAAGSMAAWSIIGYITGLGDRHLLNILLTDRDEICHIDFGIVADRGLVSTEPELIPFRLTPNFVALLGPAGSQGQFLSNCIEISRFLRANAQFLKEPFRATAIVGSSSERLSLYQADAVLERMMRKVSGMVLYHEKMHEENSELYCNGPLWGMDGYEIFRGRKSANSNLKLRDPKNLIYVGTSDVQHRIREAKCEPIESQVKLLIAAAECPFNQCMLFWPWMPFI